MIVIKKARKKKWENKQERLSRKRKEFVKEVESLVKKAIKEVLGLRKNAITPLHNGWDIKVGPSTLTVRTETMPSGTQHLEISRHEISNIGIFYTEPLIIKRKNINEESFEKALKKAIKEGWTGSF